MSNAPKGSPKVALPTRFQRFRSLEYIDVRLVVVANLTFLGTKGLTPCSNRKIINILANMVRLNCNEAFKMN